MKPFSLLIALLPLLVMAQEKGANKIVIPKVPADSVLKVLAKNGYPVALKNDYQVVTELTPTKKYDAIKIRLNFYIGDSTIELIGQTNNILMASFLGHNDSSKELTRIENRGMRNSQMKEVWDEMYRMALEISKNLTFRKD